MRGEFTVFTVKKSVMIRGCENIDVCGTRIGSQVLALAQRCGCIFGDPKARILGLRRRRKKRFAQPAVLSSEDGTIKDVAQETHLDWKTVKELDKQYMQEQLRRIGTPAPKVIGIDEISIRKGHTYRIVVSDLLRRRPIWFGGQDRSEQSMDEFYKWLGPKKSKQIRLAVMDMWKAFRKSTLKPEHAPGAAILFDKFHVLRHLGDALDQVRKSEYGRLVGKDRRFIKGQKYTLLSHRENLSTEGGRSLRLLLKANKRLNTAYVLKETFGQLWDTIRRRAGPDGSSRTGAIR
jgi:transposase